MITGKSLFFYSLPMFKQFDVKLPNLVYILIEKVFTFKKNCVSWAMVDSHQEGSLDDKQQSAGNHVAAR